MFHAFKYLEIDPDSFESEAISIMDTTSGGITRRELLKMPFDEYNLIRQKIGETIEQIKENYNVRSGSN